MDPLSVLREHTTTNKPVVLQGSQMVFGGMRIPRDAPTAYKSLATKTFYTIHQVWWYLQHHSLPHAEYITLCTQKKIRPVSLPDKFDLLNYLTGKSDHSNQIDLANAPLMGDLIAAAAEQPASKRHKPAEAAPDPLKDEQAQQLIAEARRIVAAALEGPALVPVDSDAADGAPAAEPEGGAGAGQASAKRLRPAPMPTGEALDALIRSDLPHVAQIMEREFRPATRSSLLLAPSGKQFASRTDLILKTLREQAAARASGPADAHRRAQPSASQGAAPGQLSRGGSSATKPTSGTGVPGKGGGGGQSPALIIVVPAAVGTSKINMWNAGDFLLRGTYARCCCYCCCCCCAALELVRARCPCVTSIVGWAQRSSDCLGVACDYLGVRCHCLGVRCT
jgi:hypothetical protein